MHDRSIVQKQKVSASYCRKNAFTRIDAKTPWELNPMGLSYGGEDLTDPETLDIIHRHVGENERNKITSLYDSALSTRRKGR